MATFYVDATRGSDSNSGLSAGSAWRSVEFVNGRDFAPGDTILFRAGDTYSATLAPSSSGTATAPITFGAYGSGPAPMFFGGTDVTDAAWTKVSANVWSTPVARQGAWEPQKVLFDGEPGNIASGSLRAVDQQGDWYWSGGKLYVYSGTVPSSAFHSVEANVRDYGILLDGVSHLRIQGLEVSLARQNVFVRDSSDITLTDLQVHDSVRDGILLRDSEDIVVKGGASYDNGVLGVPGNVTHLGHGVLFSDGAANNTVEGMRLYGNTEDGVQFGNGSGSNNVIAGNTIFGNLEDGVDIKNGSQTLIGNEVYGNVNNAVLIHNTSGTITLTENVLRTVAAANALDVAEGAKVISVKNWYEGVDSYTVQLQASAGNGSSFTGDVFVDGGLIASAGISIEGGAGHTFTDSTIVMRNDGQAVRIAGAAGTVTFTDSILYGDGAALVHAASAGQIVLDGNVYWSTLAAGKWVKLDNGGDRTEAWLLSVDGDGIIADPLFVDATANDFSLRELSLAAGHGASPDPVTSGGNGSSDGPDAAPAGNDGGGSSQEAPPVYANTLEGTAGADRIVGRAGNDLIHGLGGDDELKGGAGDDRLEGGAGADRLNGGDGDDVLVGGAGNDTLIGWAGADVFVFGQDFGRDTVRDFVPGIDSIDLTAWQGLDFTRLMAEAEQEGGQATLIFSDGSRLSLDGISLDELRPAHFRFASSAEDGSGGATPPGGDTPPPAPFVYEDTVTGTGGADRIVGRAGHEHIRGLAGNDEIKGGEGHDLLDGGAGADRLQGGAGDDILIGGAGADILIGWAGADTFVFAPGSGRDVIKDFERGIDRIDLSQYGLDSASGLLAGAATSNGDTTLFLSSGDEIKFEGIAPHELSDADFLT